jgi:hypothetical protein
MTWAKIDGEKVENNQLTSSWHLDATIRVEVSTSIEISS